MSLFSLVSDNCTHVRNVMQASAHNKRTSVCAPQRRDERFACNAIRCDLIPL